MSREATGKRTRSGLLAAALSLAVMLSLAACSGAKSGDSSRSEALAAMSDTANQVDSVEVDAKAKTPAAGVASSSLDVTTTSAKTLVQAGAGFVPISEPATGMNRKVIYKAQVTMKVPNFEPAEEKLHDAIHQSGGYVLQFSNSMNPDEKGASYVIKVPADGFSSFIDQLRDIQKEMQLQMEGSDVTEEYVDLDARLKAKQTVEARLLAFMDKAKGSDDLVRFSTELGNTQEQIEQIKGRMRYLDQNVAFSTVNLRLYEASSDVSAQDTHRQMLGDRLTAALTGSARALGEFGQALLVFIAALLPVAAVAVVIGIPVYAIIRGRRRARIKPAAEGSALPDAEPEQDGR